MAIRTAGTAGITTLSFMAPTVMQAWLTRCAIARLRDDYRARELREGISLAQLRGRKRRMSWRGRRRPCAVTRPVRRLSRATRTGRVTTARRQRAHGSATSPGGRDDGGGEPPESDALRPNAVERPRASRKAVAR